MAPLGDVHRAHSWTALVPLKNLATAKSRLAPVDQNLGVAASSFALAFAQDVIAALRQCARIDGIVVIGRSLPPVLWAHGVEVLPEGPTSRGLNDAVRLGWQHCRGDRSRNVIVMTADLPALTAAEIGSIISADNGRTPSFVRDLTGSGTSTLLVPARTDFSPQFGADSARRHSRLGYHDVSDWAGIGARLDVDTPDDLARAIEVGVGEHTQRLLVPTQAPPTPHRR